MKNIIQLLKVIVLALVLSFGLSYVYAWTAPTVSPPNGNVSAPINTSTTDQIKGSAKTGGLGVEGLIRGYSNAIFDGRVGIATTTPNTALTVAGVYRGTSNIRSEGEESGVVPGSGVGAELGAQGSFAYLQGFNRTAPANYSPLHLYGSYIDLQPGVGNVGIGTTTPATKLDVAGGIRPASASSGANCSPLGSQAYDGTTGAPLYCSSTGKWTAVGGGTGISGLLMPLANLAPISCTSNTQWPAQFATHSAKVDANGYPYSKVSTTVIVGGSCDSGWVAGFSASCTGTGVGGTAQTTWGIVSYPNLTGNFSSSPGGCTANWPLN